MSCLKQGSEMDLELLTGFSKPVEEVLCKIGHDDVTKFAVFLEELQEPRSINGKNLTGGGGSGGDAVDVGRNDR